jgi:hypothetical protein
VLTQQRRQCHFGALENLDLCSGVALSKSMSTQDASISAPNRIEVTVHKAFEQHHTAQISDHESCISTNERMHEKSNVWDLGDNVLERDL